MTEQKIELERNYGLPNMIAENLRELGFETSHDDGKTPYVLDNKKVLIRVNDSDIEIACKSTFDRWANSVDYTLKIEVSNDDVDVSALVRAAHAGLEQEHKPYSDLKHLYEIEKLR